MRRGEGSTRKPLEKQTFKYEASFPIMRWCTRDERQGLPKAMREKQKFLRRSLGEFRRRKKGSLEARYPEGITGFRPPCGSKFAKKVEIYFFL